MSLLLFLFALTLPAHGAPTAQNPLLCASTTSPAYNALVANRSALFHVNYSKGNVTPNGPMASESIDWDDNGVLLIGRSNFVKQLHFFMAIVPGLQIRDHIHINDGNKAAIHYTFQGFATGSFNGAPPTNARIQAQGGEMMVYDEDALLDRLVTIEEVDLLEMQVEGTLTVPAFDTIPQVTTSPTTSPEYVCKIKTTAASFSKLFNDNQTAEIETLLYRSAVTFHADNSTITSTSAVVAHFRSFRASFPDLLIHDQYIVGQGNYTAVESVAEGTFTGAPFTATNGTVVQPTGRMSRARFMRFFEHDEEGLVVNAWEVHNNNDFFENVVD